MLQGRMAPSAKVKRWLGITKSGSTVSLLPKPLHSGQAPCGLLKEKSRGSSSESWTWPSGQANFWERIISVRVRPALRSGRLFHLSQSHRLLSRRPNPKPFPNFPTACPLSSGLMVNRSTTTSILCFFCLSKFKLLASFKSITVPSTRTRAKPAFFDLLKNYAVFAFLVFNKRRQQNNFRAGF